MQNNLKNQLKNNYTVIPNELILDSNLSDRARFVFCVLASKPDNWIFYNNALAKELKYSVDTLRKYIKELSISGWITVENNKFKANNYILNSQKDTNSTVSEKTRHRKNPTPEKPDTYKEVLKVRSTINKEVKEEEEEPTPASVFVFKDLWNEACEDSGGKLDPVIKLTTVRKQKIKTRLKDLSDLAGWNEIFKKVANSKFCCGENERGWTVSFEWIIENEENALKVLEGKYDDVEINDGYEKYKDSRPAFENIDMKQLIKSCQD